MSPEQSDSYPGGGPVRLLLGNEAIAQGLFEAGCRLAAAYPGTPSTEVLEALPAYGALDLHLEWSVNEKVALETASAASYCGLRTAAVMKQVGLNVAMDPLMSLAYTGVVGGLLLIVADDPGPYSSQTEQDTRFLAMTAKVPVLDPATPEQAREMVHTGYRISEKYRIPVILRPVLRVCHSRAPISGLRKREKGKDASFVRDVNRWAATPSFRYHLHEELNYKIHSVLKDPDVVSSYTLSDASVSNAPFAIVASGLPAAYAADILSQSGMENEIPLLCVGVPFPLDKGRITSMLDGCGRLLVLEETGALMETLLGGYFDIFGRFDGTVPAAGEMTPDTVALALAKLLPEKGLAEETYTVSQVEEEQDEKAVTAPPTLCPGCSHRASFWALKKAMPGGIYTGDIGCYTLGISLGTVDTVLCMGASISQAAGFFWSQLKKDETPVPIAAVIGDSTFYHSGIPALLNAVQQGAAFVLLILDNGMSAMTGGQPSPASGLLAGGGHGVPVPMEEAIAGCGVKHIKICDPLDSDSMVGVVEDAAQVAGEGEMVVIISRSPCALIHTEQLGPRPVVDHEVCNECRICTDSFGCPALVWEDEGLTITPVLCTGCAACVQSCPIEAIMVREL